MARHIVKQYSLSLLDWSADAKSMDEETSYVPSWDGLVATEDDVNILLSRIRWLHEQGITPITAVFQPEGEINNA
jgi:hypothetical protein